MEQNIYSKFIFIFHTKIMYLLNPGINLEAVRIILVVTSRIIFIRVVTGVVIVVLTVREVIAIVKL